MAVYKRDIADINLETGNIHRSFLKHSIGYKDQQADHFGIRVFRDGEPVDLTGVAVQGIFMPPQGDPIAITSGNIVDGNVAEVILPQACYNYDGQFCLSIKLVDSTNSVTGTMRIVDGMVDNTHASGTVAPTNAVPTYQEIIAVYDEMVAATAAANGAIAAAYSSSSTYKVGDYCIHDGALYRCTTAITTAEAWTAGHWTAAKLGPDLSDLKSAIDASVVLQDFTPTLRKGKYWKFADGTSANSVKFASTYSIYGYGYRNAIEMPGTTYLYSIVYVDSNSNVIGTVDPKREMTIFPREAVTLKINFKRADGEDITDADVTAIASTVKFYQYTDPTLTMNDVPADAKATGEELGKIDKFANDLLTAILPEQDYTPTLYKGSYWKFADGKTAQDARFIRTTRIYGTWYRNAMMLDNTDYLYSIIYEDINKNIIETVDPTIGFTAFPEEAYYLCINFKRADGADVEDSDVTTIAQDVKFYTKITESNGGEEITDNLFDISALSSNVSDKNNNLVFGTASQLNGLTLIDISGENGGTFSFEWDYKNNGGKTNEVGPCVVGIDENGDAVTVESVVTGNTYEKILLTNFKDYVHRSFAYIFPPTTEKIVFGTHGTTDSTVYTFRNIKIVKLPKEKVRKMPDYYPHGSYRDYIARNEAQNAGFLHDGNILQMSETPSSIPVGDNHMGYNEFISSTWDTLLPDNYTEGDPYNEETTKIHNVKVERVSRWNSTTYGSNTDSYPIYRYIFTPQTGYDKTLFLTSGCHGNEAEGYWGLYRIIRMIYFEGYKYPALRNLRNVRFIIVPSWNPWGLQHYRRYNAFSALNTGGTDVARGLQAWSWLMASNHQITVEGVVYDITDVGEANVIYETLNEFDGAISLWLDFHTDPYAGRDTTHVDIDDPRGYTPPYGCYGYSPEYSRGYFRMVCVMDDYYNIMKDVYSFTETWHPRAATPSNSSFTGWMATLGIQCGLVEISTFMNNFPYASGSGEMMKIAQEYYGNCIAEMLR